MILQNNLNRRVFTVVVLCLILVGAFQATTAQTLTVDHVIAKNIEASGGVDNWAKINNIMMTGTYTNFSDPESFTMWRARSNKYRFDAERLNMYTVHAYDGKSIPNMGTEHVICQR